MDIEKMIVMEDEYEDGYLQDEYYEEEIIASEILPSSVQEMLRSKYYKDE